jgi:hypothetical protein
MEIQIQTRMISYWSKLISEKEIKIAHLFYKLRYNVNQRLHTSKIFFSGTQNNKLLVSKSFNNENLELGGKIEWFENVRMV